MFSTLFKIVKTPLFLVLVMATYLAIVLLSFSPVMACGGCEVYYPWMHRLPTADELEEATLDFVNNYYAGVLQEKKGNINITELWYLKVKNPGITEEYDTYEVLICFAVNLGEADQQTATYHYTSSSYDEERGFYFWPHLRGTFDKREEMDNYLEEFVIGKPLNDQLVEMVQYSGPAFVPPYYPKPPVAGSRFLVLTAVFIAMSLALASIAVRSRQQK